MREQLEQTIGRICEALEFDSAGGFTFAGSPAAVWMAPATTPMVSALQNALYANCYTREFSGGVDQSLPPMNGPDEDWLETLSAANSSKAHWEEGWQIRQFSPNGQVTAAKGRAQRDFWPGEFVRSGEYGAAPQAGTPVTVFLPNEARHSQPGFYFAFGETPASSEEEFPAVRFYWNVKQESAAALMRQLSASLNGYHVPFRFKIVNHPWLLRRSDNAVLYVGRRFYRIACEIALETQSRIGSGMAQSVPLFTLPLADGLAFAEDTGTQESFGMARCRMLAEALCQAHAEGIMTTSERVARVKRHFSNCGASFERPYLNSSFNYEFPQ